MENLGGLETQASFAWYAAYTKHQHEKKAAELLSRKGLDVFLPQQRVMHRWKDRNKELLLPLFPGYLFLHSDLRNKVEILSVPGIFFLVENAGRACAIPEEEIEAIRRLVQSGCTAKSHPFGSAGERVMIHSGPLAGISGVLVRIRKQYRVVVAVELLKQAVSVEVEVGNLIHLDASSPQKRNGLIAV